MASKENTPVSPKTPKSPKSKRGSLEGVFQGLSIAGSASPSSSSKTQRLASCLKGTFSKGWPPSMRLPGGGSVAMPFTIGMSQEYRFYDDQWRIDRTVEDKLLDVSVRFKAAQAIMDEIAQLLKDQVSEVDMETVMLEEMAAAVFASNDRAKCGLDLDETLKICMKIFRGEVYEYSERSEEYQARLDAFASQGVGAPQLMKGVVRGRREVVQHAAALQHLVAQFVKADKPLTENLIKETHKILTDGLSAADAGVFGTKSYAGTYRHGNQQAYVGAHQFTKPSEIPGAMKSMVESLKADLAVAEQRGSLDPFALAAKYCDRMVNIHPFKDGNGRMCRLILNAILMKYAGILVSLGEKGQDRNAYLAIAAESNKVGGHHGQLASMVLHHGESTLKRLRNTLRQRVRRSVPGMSPSK